MFKITDYFKSLYSNKKNLYIILIIGIIILISSNIFSVSKDKTSSSMQHESITYSVENEEKRLEDILSKVHGAGKTEVMITYDSGIEKVPVQNSKVNKSIASDDFNVGGETETTDISEEKEIVMNGSGNTQTPFVLKEINPRVRGVLVLAEGADNTDVCFNLTNAVAAVLDVPYYRIQVLQKSN